jgi:hypothetical protein
MMTNDVKEAVTIENPTKIAPTKDKKIVTKSQKKDYRIVYAKLQVISDGTFRTVPYEYKEGQTVVRRLHP